FPKAKVMTMTLEVVIWKRDSDGAGMTFIAQTLLNYNLDKGLPINPDRPCVIKNRNWELQRRPTVQKEAANLLWPQPRQFRGTPPDFLTLPNYWRYLVTLELPVGEEARKAEPKPQENK